MAFEAEAERAAKRGRRLSDPRLAALAAERAGELLERRAAIYAPWRWRSLVLLGVLTVAAFLEGRAGVLSPIEIVLPLAFWLGVHVLERRYQERVRRGAEANAELARGAGFTVPSLPPRDDRQLPRLAPAALATASIISAALLGYTLRPPPYHDLIHETYVADLNRICSHENAALAAIPMTRRPDRWQKYFTAELSARERALAALDSIRISRPRERRSLERISENRRAILAIMRAALADRRLDHHEFLLASERTYRYAIEADGVAGAAGARRCV